MKAFQFIVLKFAQRCLLEIPTNYNQLVGETCHQSLVLEYKTDEDFNEINSWYNLRLLPKSDNNRNLKGQFLLIRSCSCTNGSKSPGGAMNLNWKLMMLQRLKFGGKNFSPILLLPMLQFDCFESSVDGTFWERLAKNKMDIYKLDDSIIQINGTYSFGSKFNVNGKLVALPSRLQVSVNSFSDHSKDTLNFLAKGSLKNTNTLVEFKELDKNLYLKSLGIKVTIH